MYVYKNQTETNAVNIIAHGNNGAYRAAYTERKVDAHGRVEEIVLRYKLFATINSAVRWANKVLA